MGTNPLPIEHQAWRQRVEQAAASKEAVYAETRLQQMEREIWNAANESWEIRTRRRVAKWKATCFVVAALGLMSHVWPWVFRSLSEVTR